MAWPLSQEESAACRPCPSRRKHIRQQFVQDNKINSCIMAKQIQKLGQTIFLLALSLRRARLAGPRF
jgi:hypothetical protein